jgi:hypothetical protein
MICYKQVPWPSMSAYILLGESFNFSPGHNNSYFSGGIDKLTIRQQHSSHQHHFLVPDLMSNPLTLFNTSSDHRESQLSCTGFGDMVKYLGFHRLRREW